jgi:hypothetical protein
VNNFKIIFSVFISIALVFSTAVAERDSEIKSTDAEEELDSPADNSFRGNAPITCELRVTGNYNVRRSYSRSSERCMTFSRENNSKVTVIGQYGSDSKAWLRITSDEIRKNCPGGEAWVFNKAFDDNDFNKYSNGECGRSANDPGRTATPSTGNSEVANSSRGNAFPLDKCHGLKHKGGSGHYGARRAAGHSHGGTDYYAPKGTRVMSPCDGKVVGSAYGKVAGNMVTIKCNNGDSFKMMHLHSSPARASAGKTVSKGTIVGGVGNTGNASRQAPHLHLEHYVNGKRVDPEKHWDCHFDSGH